MLMKKHTTKQAALLAACIVLISILVWTIWGNTALEVNTYTISSDRLPEGFSGFRIAQVSDLHNAEMGEDNEKLLTMLRESTPDIIVITGDLADSYHTDIDVAIRFAENAAEIAPCYYVSGNHEARISQYNDLKAGLRTAGVVVLENERIELERSGDILSIIGVDDPSFQTGYLTGDSAAVMTSELQKLTADHEGYTILLSHRPELYDIYTASGIDLIFSGHAHGGQFRLPIVGGLIAPNQGWLPEYDSGLYTQGNTNMLVSRGIGNSIIPIRFNNRPEIIVVELLAE